MRHETLGPMSWQSFQTNVRAMPYALPIALLASALVFLAGLEKHGGRAQFYRRCHILEQALPPGVFASLPAAARVYILATMAKGHVTERPAIATNGRKGRKGKAESSEHLPKPRTNETKDRKV